MPRPTLCVENPTKQNVLVPNQMPTNIDKWTREYSSGLGPLDLLIVNHDNLGMQQKSKQALNVQYTACQDIVIREKTLYELNIYGENRLSRTKKSWTQLCLDDADTKTLAKRLVGVKQK